MKKLLIGTMLVLTACGSTPTPTPPAFNVSGAWTGTFTLSSGPVATLNLNLVQASGSDDITGTAFNTLDSATLAGKLSTGVLSGPEQNGATLTLTGVFNLTTYKGTFTQDQLRGTFSFTKNQ